MPHLGDWGVWSDSSLLPVSMTAGVEHTVTISDGFNMSYLDHYVAYLGRGGGDEPSNDVNIAEVKLLSME